MDSAQLVQHVDAGIGIVLRQVSENYSRVQWVNGAMTVVHNDTLIVVEQQSEVVPV
jgi:hypothetical protein